MTYKNLFLSVLLVPFALTSNAKIDIRIQELQNKLAAKEIELSAISKIIAEKEVLVNSLLIIGSDIASSILSDLNDQEKAKFKEEFYIFLESVKDALEFKKNIKDVLLEEFIDLSIDATVKLAEFKSLILVRSVEKVILKKLYESFAKCLQELSDIGCELGELQKQTLQN
jgi:hypothetical protein